MLENVTKLFQNVHGVIRVGRAPAEPAFRVLVAVSGGPHAPSLLDTLPGLAVPGYELQLVHVRAPGQPSGAKTLDEALDRLRAASTLARGREVVTQDTRGALVAASRDADLLVLGASMGPRPVSNSLTVELAKRSACPVIVVRAGEVRAPRAQRRALVVGERTLSARLGVQRGLRWGLAGTASVDVFLATSDDPFAKLEAEPEPLGPDPAYASVRTVEETLDAKRVTDALEAGKQDLLVLAVDPARLEGSRRWVDEVFVKTRKPVVCAFAGRKGPRTRTKIPTVTPLAV